MEERKSKKNFQLILESQHKLADKKKKKKGQP